jgi:hypothetical protein
MPLTHRPFSRSTWYLLAVIVVAQFGMVIGGILYTNYATSQQTGKFCDLIVLSDEAYKQPLPPNIPVTPTRQKLAVAMHKLREDLHCDKGR